MVQHYQGRLVFWKQIRCFPRECVKQKMVVSSYIRCGMGLQVALLIAKYKIIFIPPLATVYCTVWKNGATLPRPACFLKTDQLFFCENVWSNKWWCPRGMVLQVARGRARLLATSFSSSNARRQGRAAGRAGRQAARACCLIALRRSP